MTTQLRSARRRSKRSSPISSAASSRRNSALLLVGLTGGIASGKSTVAQMLVALGAVLIDADEIAREVVEPGTPAFDKIVGHFGRDILSADGRIDRATLGRIVFADPAERAVLNGFTHPEVMKRIAERLEELEGTEHIVVADIPLLAEVGGKQAGGSMFDLIVVVAASENEQVERMRATRGMDETDARARIASQASTSERSAIADIVIVNDGTIDELAAEVDRLWTMLEAKRGGRTPQ